MSPIRGEDTHWLAWLLLIKVPIEAKDRVIVNTLQTALLLNGKVIVFTE